MRKLCLVLVALLVVALAPNAWAGALGQPPGMTPAGKWSLSLSGEYQFEQKFKDYDLHRASSAGASDTEKKSAKFKEDQAYLATLSWGASDWLNLFAQAGWVRGGKWQDKDLLTGQEWEAKLKDNFAWGAGLKVKVWEPRPGWSLLLAGRYFRYDDRKASDWQNNSMGYQADSDWVTDDKLDYWQVDLDAVMLFKLGMVTPYLGLGWSHAEAKLSGRWSAPGVQVDYDSKMKSKEELGALAGLALELGRGFSLNLQGEFITRTAVSLGVTWTF